VVNPLRVCALGGLVLAASCVVDDRTLMVAGAAGTSGHADAGGPAGADGASDTPPLPVCQGTPLTAALITDFSDAVAGHNAFGDPDIQFGSEPDQLGGGSFTYHAPFLTEPVLSLVPTPDGQALAVMANPGVPHDSGNAWTGFGFGLGDAERNCLDASRYSGVQFTVAGSLGTCQLMFGVAFSEVQDVRLNPATGSCSGGAACYPPLSAALVPDAAGIVKVPFASIIFNGMPTNTVDAKAIVGIQWQLMAPLTGTPCAASFTLDDVTFF
jgi:hypothetical protein